jgi:succinoglycan biosynthesis transport protein ExoP
MSGDYQLSVRDYLSIAQRWAVASILTFGVILAGSVAVAMLLPHVYQSTATILMESPQVRVEGIGDVAAAGAQEERAQLIQQRIMSRDNLIAMAKKHELFSKDAQKTLSDADIATAMRNSIAINLVNNPGAMRRPASLAFDLSFDHQDPQKAMDVANELASSFLAFNSRSRVQQAEKTTEFLGAEAERLRTNLEELERQIASYKARQGGGSAETLTVAASGVQSMEVDLRAAEREQRVALNEASELAVELAAARAGVVPAGSTATTPGAEISQELDRARNELARLNAIYTDSHPDVRAQVGRVAALEKTLKSEKATSIASTESTERARFQISRLETQIAAARARADLMAQQQAQIRAALGQQRVQMARAPIVERDMAILQRDYDAARARYDDLRARQLTAQASERLQGEEDSGGFTLLEAPLLPEDPIKPNRKKIVAMGFFMAIAGATVVTALLEKLFSRVRGSEAVRVLTGLQPMVSIPHIESSASLTAARSRGIQLLWWGLGLGLLMLTLVHVFVAPLNIAVVNLLSAN